MRIAILAALSLTLALSACKSTEVQKSNRWEAYPGCNASQCKSWQSECSSECINEHTMSVAECEGKCSTKVADCEASCPG